MELIKKQFNNQEISFDLNGQGMINATEMAKANGKLISDFFRLDSTNEYLKALSSSMRIPIDEMIIRKEGGNGGGTWVHRKLAIRIAQWCSPKFAVQIDTWIEELFIKGSISFNVPKTFGEALRLAAEQQEKIEEQARKIEQDKPKVELAESIIGHKTNFSVKEFIDNLKIIVGKNKFLEILRNDGILMDYPNRNHPYQQYSKYFKIQRVIKNEESREKILITPEGYVYLSKKYQNLMEKIEVDYLIER